MVALPFTLRSCETGLVDGNVAESDFRSKREIVAPRFHYRSIHTCSYDCHVPFGAEHGGPSFLLRRPLTDGKINATTCAVSRCFVKEDATAAPIDREFGDGQSQSYAAVRMRIRVSTCEESVKDALVLASLYSRSRVQYTNSLRGR